MKINYFKFWQPHIRFVKCDVKQLSPKLYKTLDKLNMGKSGRMQCDLRDIRKFDDEHCKGYVILMYLGCFLVGYSTNRYSSWCEDISVNFWIKKKFRGQKLGQLLIQHTIKCCPRNRVLCGLTHDTRTDHLFEKYSRSPKFAYN